VPKYESFWKTTISQPSFRSAVGTAANGATNRVAVDGIRPCSPTKKNWYGIVRVRHGGIVTRSKGDLAAPGASLGRVLANDGMLAAWPTVVFRFTIDRAGDWLTVQAEENAAKTPGVFMPTAVGAKPEPATEKRTERPHPTAERVKAGMTDCLDELRSGPLHQFRDWPRTKSLVPETSGVYTIWDRIGQFLYAGRSDSLRSRLNSHWLGNRANDQFNVYIADRVLLATLTSDQVAQIGTGKLRFDELIREYIRTNLDFRFCQTNDARVLEETIRAGRWPYGRTPILNPLSSP
jgi:hypothetical protein